MNHTFKEQQEEIKAVKDKQKSSDAEHRVLMEKLKAIEAENRLLAEKILKLESRADQVREGIVRVEKEVESGMQKAKDEVRQEVSGEMKEREERDANVVFYGVPEQDEPDAESRREKEKKTVQEIIAATGADAEDAAVVKFRLGRWETARDKPRPLLVRIEDEEKRARLMSNARKLGATARWKTVFINRDLTWTQREEARKNDVKAREEAERRTNEAKNEGRTFEFKAVGPWGKKRVVPITVRAPRGAGVNEGQT